MNWQLTRSIIRRSVFLSTDFIIVPQNWKEQPVAGNRSHQWLPFGTNIIKAVVSERTGKGCVAFYGSV